MGGKKTPGAIMSEDTGDDGEGRGGRRSVNKRCVATGWKRRRIDHHKFAHMKQTEVRELRRSHTVNSLLLYVGWNRQWSGDEGSWAAG